MYCFITNAAVIIFIIIVIGYYNLNYVISRAIVHIYTGRLLLATENTIEYSH